MVTLRAVAKSRCLMSATVTLCISVVAFLGHSPNLYAQAQAFTASLAGSVYDHTGAALPETIVILSNPDRAFTRTLTTATDGRYTFTLLPPGTYTLKVEKTGFRPYVQSGVVLAVGQAASQDVTLELGAVTQQLTVTAAAPMLNMVRLPLLSPVAMSSLP